MTRRVTVDAEALERPCDWCGDSIPPEKRRDSITCSQSCRQARHRFRQHLVVEAAAAQPLRLAVGDPPYPGLARKYYQHEPDYAGEVDHAELLSQLAGVDVCIAAWFRGERKTGSTKPLQAWEPVVYVPARRVVSSSPAVDALVHRAHPRTTEPRRAPCHSPRKAPRSQQRAAILRGCYSRLAS